MAEVRAVDALRAEIKSVDSKTNLLAEKIKRLEAQNVTLANSLFKLTERIKKVEEGSGQAGARTDAEQSEDIVQLREELKKAVTEYEAVKNDLQNLKYTVGLINPLEFVTARQVNELVEEKMEKIIREKSREKAKKEKKED